MDNTINIRKATLPDLDAIVAIENTCFDEAHDRFSRRQLSYLITHAKGAFYVAESDGQITGYLSLLQRSDSTSLRIYSIAVHPDARGQKIGQQLLNKTKEYAKENDSKQISLEVRVDNEVAIKLYLKTGFFLSSILKKYYGDGTDAFHMKMSI